VSLLLSPIEDEAPPPFEPEQNRPFWTTRPLPLLNGSQATRPLPCRHVGKRGGGSFGGRPRGRGAQRHFSVAAVSPPPYPFGPSDGHPAAAIQSASETLDRYPVRGRVGFVYRPLQSIFGHLRNPGGEAAQKKILVERYGYNSRGLRSASSDDLAPGLSGHCSKSRGFPVISPEPLTGSRASGVFGYYSTSLRAS